MLKRATEARAKASGTDIFPAPTGGWAQSGNVVTAPKDQAEVLDNFIPTAQGARLRGGISEFADMGAAAQRLFVYSSAGAQDFFGSTEAAIFDVVRLNGGSNAFAEVEGLSSGDWSTTQISTSGGQFLVAVNGSDHGMYWDGTDWNPIVTEAVNDVGFDAESSGFAVGETVTGGTSGATATILAITKTSATAGVLKVGTITGGPYQDNEALTSAGGAATADGASASASSVTITNVATADLSQVWLFKERLFFVEGGTSSVWYLPVESIGGAASEIDLGSVLSKGGSILFGATWSLDSGSGVDDVCLFVSDQGEIAVYEGTDPSSASTWSLVGVYEVGTPLNKHAFFQSGGDLAILTEDGIVPVSEALRKDRAALQVVALTYPIEDAWKEAIANRSVSYPISATLWQAQTFLLVGTPAEAGGKPVSYVANARTGAWGRITGWDVRCSGVYTDQLYFGDNTGKIYSADTGGNDDGVGYTGIYVPKFSPNDSMRSANMAGITYKATADLDFDLDAFADYEVGEITPPATTVAPSGSTWGAGIWGTFIWGSGSNTNTYTNWQTVYANGYALAPSLAITTNQTSLLAFEVLVFRLRYESGYPL